jgi:hypothetical protein
MQLRASNLLQVGYGSVESDNAARQHSCIRSAGLALQIRPDTSVSVQVFKTED